MTQEVGKPIKPYFDTNAIDRDKRLTQRLMQKYEQEVRQKAVMELLSPNSNDIILDIGCGNA